MSPAAAPAGPRVRLRVRLTPASAVVLGFVVLLAALFAPGFGAFAGALLAVLVVLGCIAWHELGHVLAARALGFEVLEVRLGLLDSATAYEGEDRTAHDRVLCALAGPVASLVLAVALGLAAWLQGGDSGSNAISTLAVLNLVVALANLVPVKGTDGWEILAGLRGHAG